MVNESGDSDWKGIMLEVWKCGEKIEKISSAIKV
jgi:hypothetical protein